jgi:nicotinate phosphoribosyltransferase
MDIASSPLLTDLYQLTMMQAYLDHGETLPATFEFLVRSLPPERSFLVAAGLDPVIDYLETLRFPPDDIAWLASTGRFAPDFLEYLADFRFSGEVEAMPEGTIFFPQEPVLRVTAPLPEAQLVETRIVNLLHYQSSIASKAARMVLAAPGRLLVDFGLRRAHGGEAGLMAARASYIAGLSGTATLLAEKLYGIPTYGTMAHSFVEVHDDEAVAFENFASSRTADLTLLIDTYDTATAARKIVALAPRLAARGTPVSGVRLDSGDLVALSKRVRTILDEGGLGHVTIFASGGLDEAEIARLVAAGAPIDGFGVGTCLATSSDVPALDCAYKLQAYAGVARRKKSTGKASWPGVKQVWRRYGDDGRMAGDVVSLEDDPRDGEPLLAPVMRAGRRLVPRETLATSRERAARELATLPDTLRDLEPARRHYPVEIAPALVSLAEAVDRRLGLEPKAAP